MRLYGGPSSGREHVHVSVRGAAGGALALSGGGTLPALLDAARGTVIAEVRNAPGDPGFDAPYEAVARRLVDVLRARSGDDVTVTSFDWFAIEVARDAGLRTGFVTPPGLALEAALAYVADARHAACHPHWTAVVEDPAAVARAHAAGVEVVAWGVPDEAALERLREAGVDGAVLDHD